MHEDMNQVLEKWKRDLEDAWRHIPKPYRNDHSVRRTLQCRLYGRLHGMGFRVVADYTPPRVLDRPVDLIALKKDDRDLAIEYAICFDNVVTLAAVKCLSSFEAVNKIILTFSVLEKKVQESRFFLKPDIQHLHLRAFSEPL
jgi:hypothetical protein